MARDESSRSVIWRVRDYKTEVSVELLLEIVRAIKIPVEMLKKGEVRAVNVLKVKPVEILDYCKRKLWK